MRIPFGYIGISFEKCVKNLKIISLVYMVETPNPADSSVGRAWDCSWLVVFLGSLVRFRFGGVKIFICIKEYI